MENYKEGTRTNYMRHLRQADEWSIYFENDFWMNLHRAWKASDFSKVKNLCKEHESSFEKDRKAAEKHKEYGESPEKIASWIPAFRAYVKFINAKMENASPNPSPYCRKLTY
ncbi:MAG: hypothetical protein K2H35_06955 [Muribaculaceae bacterium]|nr:hypothetical protein [Muribaculaceae bacterium]